MKTYGGVDVKLHSFLMSELDRDKWIASHSSRFIPGEGLTVSAGEEAGCLQNRYGCGDENRKPLNCS